MQIDDAWLPALWDRIGVKMGLEAYQRYCMVRVEALNHALENVPEEQVRYHLCWGSWHGPHAHDIPMADMVDIMLAVKAQAYLFEAANARHEHEYTLWERVKLPKGKILAPGVVSHATTLIEHPELVSQRIQRFARIVGRENVIASTDCGLGLRCHPQIAWAKLRALVRGCRAREPCVRLLILESTRACAHDLQRLGRARRACRRARADAARAGRRATKRTGGLSPEVFDALE